MKIRVIIVLLFCAALLFTAGCTSPSENENQTPVPTGTAGPSIVYPASGLDEEGRITAQGYGTKEFTKVLFDRGPVTFHATFDGPEFFEMEISLHGADVAKPFTNVKGPLDEIVTIDIGAKDYYYVVISGQGNWTVVQS